MSRIQIFFVYFCLCFMATWSNYVLSNDKISNDKIRLYALDCGTIDVSDMSDLSGTGEYSGQKTQLVNPCFLIRHPKGDLLWDTGLIDSLADKPDGELEGVWHSKLKTGLIKQLEQLNISADDIEYLSLSHIHPDHSGNANQFKNSTFIINQLEREYMFSEPIKSYFGELYSELETAKTVSFENKYDVFKDNSVVIQSMPGHTPGSSVLLVRLQNSGNILLTGDLYVHSKGRELKTMHKYNFDKQLTIDSREKFETLVKQENAKVVIQHEKNDFAGLAKFPEYLD